MYKKCLLHLWSEVPCAGNISITEGKFVEKMEIHISISPNEETLNIFMIIFSGLCSADTETALSSRDNCLYEVFRFPGKMTLRWVFSQSGIILS